MDQAGGGWLEAWRGPQSAVLERAVHARLCMRGCHLRHPRVVLEDARDQVLGAAVRPVEQQRGVRVQQLRLHEDVVVRLLAGKRRGA